MQILDATQTARALPYSQLVPAIAIAAADKAAQRIRAPERQVVPIDPASVLLSMPAIGADISAVKLITVHGANAQHGLPAIQGEVVVFETATGRRLALLDGPTVTARRTAAVTLLGIQRLARQQPSTILLIGTGAQAMAHAEALIDFLGIRRFWIAGSSQQRAGEFCAALQKRYPEVAAQPVAAAAIDCARMGFDVVIALTTSRTPVVPADIPASTLAIGVGAFKPEMAELPAELLHGRRIVVDDLAGAQHEAGDLMQAGVDWSKVRELSQITEEDRQGKEPVPIFKTVGQAAWDLAAARVALDCIKAGLV